MHITRLHLLGFKSFVEPAELVIERGLTGVVGPNGCGKSNLLEALRWVMGETSYKNMRASSMEDVIFSGTSARPARNIAEVTIHLDNRDRKAHPAFNDDDNLEIIRRIERDNGSQYLINGKTVRARDVQLIFADASTGARSPALVQQGRIGEIVSAKPRERRFILEEAAGITGLHTRRHEAEIKLRGAENNLERLQDIIGQMETRLSGLKRQQRQAIRYKEMSRKIERLQILQMYSDYLSFQTTMKQAEQTHQEALSIVGEKTRDEAQIRQLQIEAANKLPELREREMVAAAVLQRLNINAEQIEREQESLQKRKSELTARCAQIDSDLAREERTNKEDQQRLSQLKAELDELENAASDGQNARKTAEQKAQAAQDQLAKSDEKQLALGARLAEQKAHRSALERARLEKQNLLESQQQKRDDLLAESLTIEGELTQIADFDALNQQIEHLGQQMLFLDQTLQSGELKINEAQALERQTQTERLEASSKLSTLKAEINTLEKLLHSPLDSMERPVLEEIQVAPGYEAALGAAFGDDLEASLDEKAVLFWREKKPGLTPALIGLPEGTTPLDQLVSAPQALSARLSMTGLVGRDEGDEKQQELETGQRLVSLEGDLWRWDGFVARADAPSAAAARLAQKNRLEELQNRLEDQIAQNDQAAQNSDLARKEREQLQVTHKTMLEKQHDIRKQQEQKRLELANAERMAASKRARLEAIRATCMELNERLETESSRLVQVNQELAGLHDLSKLETQLEQHTNELARLRSHYHRSNAEFEALKHTELTRLQQIQRLANEIDLIGKRLHQSSEHKKTLTQRRQEDALELTQLGDLPEQIQARREALHKELTIAQTQRQQAGDLLQQGENALREIEKSLQDIQNAANMAREERARCETRLEAARTRLGEQIKLIETDLSCEPEECPQRAGLTSIDELPDRTVLERQLAKATSDRERLGSVNLRAEAEAGELASEIEGMSKEHNDLVEAISALRTAISGLNKEGRRRLLSAFNEINEHFEKLFTSLFGGGKASLALIESDDPLQAGLEIIASPPGKKPQVLTLLSGGEKALTALSLIFAVFLTNPAPICVLDEVDAPLDDANVERFCKLLDEMTRQTATRFLVITHHPTTMSHMDRLFGVTMAEKGISQLVSVDLSTAEKYRETA